MSSDELLPFCSGVTYVTTYRIPSSGKLVTRKVFISSIEPYRCILHDDYDGVLEETECSYTIKVHHNKKLSEIKVVIEVVSDDYVSSAPVFISGYKFGISLDSHNKPCRGWSVDGE